MSQWQKLVVSFYMKEAQLFAKLRAPFYDLPERELLERVRWALIRDFCENLRLAYSLGTRRLQFSCHRDADMSEDSMVFSAVEAPRNDPAPDDFLAELERDLAKESDEVPNFL